METREIELETGELLVTDVTAHAAELALGRGDGLLHLFTPHATAGLGLMETGSGSEHDLAAAVERLLPRTADYRHRHGRPGHGADHLLPLFVSPSLVVSVLGGELRLGTWQRIVLIDPNRDNRRRRLQLSFLAAQR